MRLPLTILVVIASGTASARADEVIYSYDGEVHPYDPGAGWINGNPCDGLCTEHLEDGHYVLRWPEAGYRAGFDYSIASPPDPPPPTLWVEWRFRSNHPLPPNFYTCDADFVVKYGGVFSVVFIYGDAVVSQSGNDFAVGLELDDFHDYRFESIDGVNYTIAVDGLTFIAHREYVPNGYHFLQFGGTGGCTSDQIPNMINEWDFIRFGTISYGEQIVASDPPSGFLDARVHADLDRLTVTFDEPNYVYIDEINVEVTGDGEAPIVTQTRRLDNGAPDTMEIVLDRPIPMGETTTFTFDDGVAVNVVEYTFAPGDTNGNGLVDLADIAEFQRCFGQSDLVGPCLALDLAVDHTIDLDDFAGLSSLYVGP